MWWKAGCDGELLTAGVMEFYWGSSLIESWVRYWERAECDRELLRAECDGKILRVMCDGELGVMESWVRWRDNESWVWWRDGCDGELLKAGCDGEMGVMESWVWWRVGWAELSHPPPPLGSGVWCRSNESWVSWRVGCAGELLGAGCGGKLDVMESYWELGVIQGYWGVLQNWLWEFLFSPPPLWCRFIILDYERCATLPHHLHTPTNGPIRVLLVLVSTEIIRTGLSLNMLNVN